MKQNSLATKLLPVQPGRANVQEFRRDRGKIQLTIDGVPVSAEPGMTILDVARRHGIEIPVLCHQANERPVGVCRMCSVETGERALTAACTRAAENGMVVKTTTEKVRKARGVLLELLLAEHPSPCIRQQRSGDCELENLALAQGVLESRFPVRTGSRGVDSSSAAIHVDHTACILCDRCIRACNEVRHNGVLGRMGKGYDARIAFDLDDPMGSSSCISCGECMVSCPTGALTNKTVVPAELPDGQPADPHFLKQLQYFEGVSSTFLELNRNAVVVRRFAAGEMIYREGEYGSTAFLILEGRAEMLLESFSGGTGEQPTRANMLQKWTAWLTGVPLDFEPTPLAIGQPIRSEPLTLGEGDLAGETSCVNHYPRAETVQAATQVIALELLRNVLDMMLQRNSPFRKLLDSNYRERALGAFLRGTPLLSSMSGDFLSALKEFVELIPFEKGEIIFEQGSPAESFGAIRNGFVKISQALQSPGQPADGEIVIEYLGPGQHFGISTNHFHPVTSTALEHVDVVKIDRSGFDALLCRFPEDRARFLRQVPTPAPGSQTRRPVVDISLQQFLSQGLNSANSALILDLEKCTRCDACVKACADAHDGVTRLIREGMRFDKYLVATSCRQCRDPLCMVGCPVGSIRRRASLEIVIEDWCIGCGLCAENCPYGSIQ